MFVFPQELTIVQVDECKKKLVEIIDSNDVISFDDSQLSRVDTIGIQLILATVTYISSQKKSLHWQSTSPVLKKSIQSMGLNEAILNQYFDNRPSSAV